MGGLDFTIYTKEDLKEAVQALGFLPLFANEIQDFSIEEHTVPKAWFSDFANFRRDGYDFDALYDDGLANYRDKELYELLERELTQKNTSSKFRLLLTGQLVKSKNTRGIQDEC